jgi:hypothetical protein
MKQKHDENFEAIKAIWQKLTWWQKKHLILLATLYLVQSEIKRIPIRWFLWQLKRK